MDIWTTRWQDERVVTVKALAEHIFRVRLSWRDEAGESLLSRYGIFQDDLGQRSFKSSGENQARTDLFTVAAKQDSLQFTSADTTLTVGLAGCQGTLYKNDGFRIAVPLLAEERLFGLGDENRTMIMKRGHRAIIWQTNVTSYGPIPYLMSDAGWAILVNCTYGHVFDVGASDKTQLLIDSDQGVLDFYLFFAADLAGLLEAMTAVAGRPVLLPKSAYGLTFVCNEEETARQLIEDSLMFRKLQIPLDYMGLEPGWMEKHYDFSLDKKWDPDRFYLPTWEKDNYSGSWSFFYNLRQLGVKLSLWLCCNYDFFWAEENSQLNLESKSFAGAEIKDPRFAQAFVMDKVTKPGVKWFEHLKKFVDQGAEAFKLDGSNQIIEHPDRLWAGQYTDAEIHNIYPLIYAKQMKEGYEEYTGKRALLNTPGLYAGSQQYAASWAGDTGGKLPTLVSILNLALCGHANHSCDLDISSLASLHYGFFMPWIQQNGWRNWMYPWMLGEEIENIYRDYAQLRSSLFPYIYATAHQAAATGLPIARPLSLVYPEPAYDEILHQFMFGDAFLIAAFLSDVTLPAGDWYDFWTEELYQGGQTLSYTPPAGKGGPAFVKAGSIIVRQDWMPYLSHHIPERLYIHVYPGADGEFILYEDDGETYGYQKGQLARTRIRLVDKKDQLQLLVQRRQGEFPEMAPVSAFTVLIHGLPQQPVIKQAGQTIVCSYDPDKSIASFDISRAEHEKADLGYEISVG